MGSTVLLNKLKIDDFAPQSKICIQSYRPVRLPNTLMQQMKPSKIRLLDLPECLDPSSLTPNTDLVACWTPLGLGDLCTGWTQRGRGRDWTPGDHGRGLLVDLPLDSILEGIRGQGFPVY